MSENFQILSVSPVSNQPKGSAKFSNAIAIVDWCYSPLDNSPIVVRKKSGDKIYQIFGKEQKVNLRGILLYSPSGDFPYIMNDIVSVHETVRNKVAKEALEYGKKRGIITNLCLQQMRQSFRRINGVGKTEK